MLLDRATLEGIRAGRISLAFRRWKRPTVRSGGTLLTAIGQLEIEAVERVEPGDIDEGEAMAAGFEGLEPLLALLDARESGDVYRVCFGRVRPDPRDALRAEVPDADGLEEIVSRLARLDARSSRGAWTRTVLESIARRPEVRASELASELGRDRDSFKADVRKLKRLGLTESLHVGYRLSPRGEAVLAALGEAPGAGGRPTEREG